MNPGFKSNLKKSTDCKRSRILLINKIEKSERITELSHDSIIVKKAHRKVISYLYIEKLVLVWSWKLKFLSTLLLSFTLLRLIFYCFKIKLKIDVVYGNQ